MRKLIPSLLLISFSGFSLAGTPAEIAAGKQTFEQYCVICHGIKGHGDTPTGKALKAANLYNEILAHEAKGEADHLIEEIMKGEGAMPAWEGVINKQQAQQVLDYIKAINGPS